MLQPHDDLCIAFRVHDVFRPDAFSCRQPDICYHTSSGVYSGACDDARSGHDPTPSIRSNTRSADACDGC